MSWKRLGQAAVPFAVYVFVAMALFNWLGFWQALNPVYAAMANAAVGAWSGFGIEPLSSLLSLLRLGLFAVGFAVLYSPALLLTRRPDQIAALAILGSLPIAIAMLARPQLFYAVAGNGTAQVAGILLLVLGVFAARRLGSRKHRLAANNSSKPTPLRGAA